MGEVTGEVTERMGRMVEEGWFVWWLEVQILLVGPSGLLNRLVRLGVLTGVTVSL